MGTDAAIIKIYEVPLELPREAFPLPDEWKERIEFPQKDNS